MTTTTAPKTSADLQAELSILATELTSTQRLAGSTSECQRRLSVVTSQRLLGAVGIAEVTAASNAYDAAIEAIARVPLLQAAVEQATQDLSWAQSKERAAFCHSIAAEYAQQFTKYTTDSKALLDTFRSLNSLSNKHMALTNRSLLTGNQALLNLPMCHNASDDIHSFPTGQQVMSGSLK